MRRRKGRHSRSSAAINKAREAGNIESLREIADNPTSFILRQGWPALDLNEGNEVQSLHKLYVSLEREIVGLLETANRLRESDDFELFLLSQKPGLIEEVAAQQKASLLAEIAKLKIEAEHLETEIDELVEGVSKAYPNAFLVPQI